MLLTDLALGMLLVILAMAIIWRFADLFRKKGRWKEEWQQGDMQEVKS